MAMSSPNAPMIRARSLTKRFGERVAVSGIDFDVNPGEFFGFLGPNGAGKTTTMRMIAGVSPRSSGELEILGGDPDRDGARIRAEIGVVHQQETLDQELTVRENLLVFGRFFGMDRTKIATRADELPSPYDNLPGFFFAHVTRSPTFFAGTRGLTTRI